MPKRKPYNCFGCGRKCTDEYRTLEGNPVCPRCCEAYDVAIENEERNKERREAKLNAKVEPKETAEAICDAAGVPREMASKMIVTTIS